MALYTKKEGVYVKLTKDQLWKMKRADDVIRLQNAAMAGSATMLALAGWLTALDKRSNKVSIADLAVCRIPNRSRVTAQAKYIQKMVDVLRGGSK